jgi:predicted CoA-binding protein
MPTLKEAAENFLQLQTIAVAGVSSTKKGVGNLIFDKLKKTGYQVYAINPSGKDINGEPSYADLGSTPKKAEGVVICTHPDATQRVVEDCAKFGIKHAWIHRSVDNGSYSSESEDFCKEHGINLIPVGCPMMFCKPVDFGHKCIKWFLHSFGKMPRKYD